MNESLYIHCVYLDLCQLRAILLLFILHSVGNCCLLKMSLCALLSTYFKCLGCGSDSGVLLGSSQASSPQHKPQQLELHPGQQSANGNVLAFCCCAVMVFFSVSLLIIICV